ncbi:putative nuclease with TOPRIM domain [Paraburkholderia sp. EB58]|jgi:predicted nuclease with TOPRIM domain|uniref:DNA-binding protein n=1 Tax=Paraburkholderia sp. EB58 TaxID=3035125 RepID=UPI003D2285A1
MARPAAVSPDQIRTTVLAMLAEAEMDPEHAPPTPERFRKVVSVRKLRARLGAGDPAMLSRALNTIEVEVVRAGLAQVAIPGLPDTIAEQMRALWQAAVTVQLDEVVQMKAAATQASEAADVAQRDADLRVELLRVELADLRDQLSARDTALATVRAEFRAASEKMTDAERTALDVRAALTSANAQLGTAKDEHAAAIAAIHARYEGLSRQLLQETEHQRHALQVERERLSGQITQAQERVAALEGLRDRLLTELASERDAHQRAAGEAAALTAVIAEQRALLQTVHAAQTVQAGTRRPARAAPAPGRHRKTPAASTPAATPSPNPGGAPARRKAR